MTTYRPKVNDMVEVAGKVLAIKPKLGVVTELWGTTRNYVLVQIEGGGRELHMAHKLKLIDWRIAS